MFVSFEKFVSSVAVKAIKQQASAYADACCFMVGCPSGCFVQYYDLKLILFRLYIFVQRLVVGI